jgi:hypothetical protein
MRVPVISYHEGEENKPIRKVSKPSGGYSYDSMTIYRPNF